jgi:hypothetical protein
MGSFEDFEPRMKKLERRLTDIWSDIQSMPPHAPLRKKRLNDYDRLSAELASVKRDALAAQGQISIFEEENNA